MAVPASKFRTPARRKSTTILISQHAALLEINALAEWNFGKFALFLNALNLTGEQQQDHSPLLRPASMPGLGGNPVVDAWAPLVGRYFSLGLRGNF
jgi:hypothetical protein